MWQTVKTFYARATRHVFHDGSAIICDPNGNRTVGIHEEKLPCLPRSHHYMMTDIAHELTQPKDWSESV